MTKAQEIIDLIMHLTNASLQELSPEELEDLEIEINKLLC